MQCLKKASVLKKKANFEVHFLFQVGNWQLLARLTLLAVASVTGSNNPLQFIIGNYTGRRGREKTTKVTERIFMWGPNNSYLNKLMSAPCIVGCGIIFFPSLLAL